VNTPAIAKTGYLNHQLARENQSFLKLQKPEDFLCQPKIFNFVF